MTGIDLQTENVARLIQLALGPVFLINGVGITLGMLTSRLSRIVDRARSLEVQRETTSNEKTLAHIDFDLKVIARRARYINSAIALLMYRARRAITLRSKSMCASVFSFEVVSRCTSSDRARSTMRDNRLVNMPSVMPTPLMRNTGPSASWISRATFSVCRSMPVMGRKSATMP